MNNERPGLEMHLHLQPSVCFLLFFFFFSLLINFFKLLVITRLLVTKNHKDNGRPPPRPLPPLPSRHVQTSTLPSPTVSECFRVFPTIFQLSSERFRAVLSNSEHF